MPGRVDHHPEPIRTRLRGGLLRPESEYRHFGAVEVRHVDVDVRLLGYVATRPGRPTMIVDLLERQATVRGVDLDPIVVIARHEVATHDRVVEVRKGECVGTIQRHHAEAPDRGWEIAVHSSTLRDSADQVAPSHARKRENGVKSALAAADEMVMESTSRGPGDTAVLGMSTAVLLVEDDDRISEPLIRVLRSEGFEVEHVDAGLPAIDAVIAACPDLVLLDLTLPDIDGLDVCRKIRAVHPELPIIMLTARAEEMDVIVGLNAGADDYVAKPFRLAELVARIRARLRVIEHSTSFRQTGPLTGAGIELHTDARRCFVTDTEGRREEIELTTKEFDLLELLMSQPGVTLKREQIMSEVWDENWWGSTRTLDTHTSTLRRKILDDSDPPSKIVTVRGVGFRFDPAAESINPPSSRS